MPVLELRPAHPRFASMVTTVRDRLIRPPRGAARVAAQREFTNIAALMRRVATALKLAADPLERAQLASELRTLQLEIDSFVRRHDSHISKATRKYLADASLQIEIKLTAMAARAARRSMPPPHGG